MALKEIAAETLRILEQGGYTNTLGRFVSLQPALKDAIEGTCLYAPETGKALLQQQQQAPGILLRTIEVTGETTQAAARRLCQEEGLADVVVLNFASARNPGGGFLSGARAQEEDLTRCSGLYPCLVRQGAFYTRNREYKSPMYTDNIIYSPRVPWFRSERNHYALLDAAFCASVITAPAPNKTHALTRAVRSRAVVEESEKTLQRRAGIILAIAHAQGHRNLVLGAWGCGVFGNDAAMVADAFATWLEHPRFVGCFERIVFAIYDPSPTRNTFRAFDRRFRL